MHVFFELETAILQYFRASRQWVSAHVIMILVVGSAIPGEQCYKHGDILGQQSTK